MKRSDQPEKIAAKHGMTLAQLKEVNGIPGNKKIVAGQTLLVPLRRQRRSAPARPAGAKGCRRPRQAEKGEVLPGE